MMPWPRTIHPLFDSAICLRLPMPVWQRMSLPQVMVVEDYWREIHGGKIVHVTLNPQYAFDAEQVAEIRKRFEFLKTFTFSGAVTEQLEAIRTSFGELIVGLRQEQAWATASGITFAINAKTAVPRQRLC